MPPIGGILLLENLKQVLSRPRIAQTGIGEKAPGLPRYPFCILTFKNYAKECICADNTFGSLCYCKLL